MSAHALSPHVKQIGIFGGTFNPPHIAHIALAQAFYEQAGLDEVWLMVSPQNPFKVNDDLLDDTIRLEMLQAATADTPWLKASNYEFALPKPSYTYHTLTHLSHDYPDVAFSLLIGGDNWAAFDKWFKHEEILERYPIYVYPRHDCALDASSLPPSVHILEAPQIHVSSTLIRQRVSQGLPIEHLLSPKVASIIRQYGCYQDEK